MRPERLVILAITFCVLSGCASNDPAETESGSSNAAQLADLQAKYVVNEAPETTMTIPRLRKKLTPKEAIEGEPEPEPPPESMKVVLAGKVCEEKDLPDNPDFPWQPGKATFMMIDLDFKPSAHAEEHEDGEECPFCLKKEQDAQALVQVIDDDGELLGADARELFGIGAGQTVVVSGTASLLAGMLMLEADSVFVSP